MTVLEIAMEKMQHLSQLQQQEVLNFIEFLAVKSGTNTLEAIAENSVLENLSCYELTKNWIGIADDLPSDLSVNKDYLQGYGE